MQAWTPLISRAALLAALALGCGSTEHGVNPGHGSSGSAGDGAGGALASAGSSGLNLGGVLQTDGGLDCHRDVSLTAVTLSDPQPFDLIIVADHSGSLAWSRSALSAGLRDLLTNIKGRAARIFILTPTQYGASSGAAQKPLAGDSVVAWDDPGSKIAYSNAMTTYTQSCTNAMGVAIACPSAKGPDPYKVQGKWTFDMPAPIATLTPSMSDADFAAEQQTVADAILAIEGTGSPHEQPLCTLSRYVSQPKASLPQNAVFLLISDEDDISTPVDCLTGFTGELNVTESETGSTVCSSNCDAYRFTMTADYFWKRLPFTCAAFDDLGNPIAGTERMSWLNQAQQASCAGFNAGPCTADEQQQAGMFCDAGLKLVKCDRECANGSTSCTVDLHDPTVNACSQAFTFSGSSYANVPAYCATIGNYGWQNCTGGGVKISSTSSESGTSSTMSLMPGTTTADISRYFTGQASAVFAGGGYLVEAIVLDPAFSCPLGAGQSYAKTLASLAGPSHVFPLCQSYAPALDGVLGFAQTLIQTQFSLVLLADEQVTFVHVITKGGAERVLADNQFHYDRAAQILSIDRTALTGQDATLRVEVTSDCRPIK